MLAVCDGEMLARARAQRHRIAIFAIEGAIPTGSYAPRTIENIAEAAFGVDKGSARVSVETAALSLSFDPRRVAFAAMQTILDRKLATMRLSLLPMTIID